MGLRVLSLFDGIACGMQAFKELGIPINVYYASEIEPNAIKVAKANHPEIVEIGDVTKIDFNDYIGKVDIVIGGSPCQGFSVSGRGLAFKDKRSALIKYFFNAVETIKPKYFLLENVRMKKENREAISRTLKIEPIEINSALLSAQNRVRLYWTSIPDVGQPEDRNIQLTDILEQTEWVMPGAIRGRNMLLNKDVILGGRLNKNGVRQDYNPDIPIVQCLEIRATNRNKSNCLTTVEKDNVLSPLSVGRYPDAFGKHSGAPLAFRYYTRREYERLQTLPDGYTDAVSETIAKKALGNAWTVDVIKHIFSFIPKEDYKN